MNRPKRLLLLCEDGMFGDQVLVGIETYFRQRGNWEFHREEDRHPNMHFRVTAALKEWKPDGVIAQVRSIAVQRSLRRVRVPVVNFSVVRKSRFPTVTVDCSAIGREAARHFLENRFRHFGYVFQDNDRFNNGCHVGFMRELARAGFSCEIWGDLAASNPLQREYDWIRNQRRLGRWLASLPKPAAVFCAHDAYAREVMQLCQSLDLRIPRDVAVMGVGNHEPTCRMTTPSLSSIDVDSQRVGFEAAHLLDRLHRGKKPPKAPILIAPLGVVERQSSHWLPDGDEHVAQTLGYIREHLSEPLSVKALTRVSLLTRRAMDFHFHKVLGRTVGEEIKHQRVQKAKGMLEESSMSISAIAHALGFNDSRALSRVFRAAMDILPSKYRADMGRNVSRTGRLLQTPPSKPSL